MSNYLSMLSIQDYMLVEQLSTVMNNTINESASPGAGNAVIEDGVVIIPATYVDIGIPIDGVTVSVANSLELKGDELMDVYDNFESGDYQKAFDSLVKIVKGNEDLAKKAEENAEEDIYSLTNITINVEGLRIYPPKCKDLGVYIECDVEAEREGRASVPGINLKPTGVVLGPLGKVSLSMVFKLMLKCAKLYAGVFTHVFNSILTDPESKEAKPIDDKAMEDEMLNMIQKAIKDNADDIKSAEGDEKSDEDVKSLLTKEVLTEIIAAAK